ncbi:M20/M25/M40 family metallo-hydrolase [Hydrogenimonas sp.]|uniref:M20/M25/M40 family metallo-hydrolase n=1 Tax=Hydrogenimonas sp. TaxID=2231112 RepID=UPI00263068F4|nr:M20/M25/M40 family metallo-hydrolase [Hydrogenimonas sp.]
MDKKGVIEIFETLIHIPHCSSKTSQMRRYLAEFAQSCGYRVEIDAVGNVMAYGEGSRVTLQSHYDMVCIGKAPDIEPVAEGGWMYARESSLGADNGMGMAMMLQMMQRGAPIDALFTNDEEIGLIGAGALELPIRTPNLLNLDSEELGKVYIGCAGGEDIHAKRAVKSKKIEENGVWYRLHATAPGGHSGVNIADGIPNAISELCRYIYDHAGMEVAWMEGGERINAIPRSAKALVWVPAGMSPMGRNGIAVESASGNGEMLVAEGRELVKALFGFAHGVREWNRDLNLPQDSINLAIVKMDGNECNISLSARSMDNDDLARLVKQSVAGWEAYGFVCRTEGKYPAWKPEVNPFSETVLKEYRNVVPEVSYAAIHAGLECALFADRFPDLHIASIGPTILDPHSDRERVDLDSVEKIMKVVDAVIADLSSI